MMIRPSLSPDYIIYLSFDVCVSFQSGDLIFIIIENFSFLFVSFSIYYFLLNNFEQKKATLSKSKHISMQVLLDELEWNMRR